MDKLQLRAFAQKLRGETLDEARSSLREAPYMSGMAGGWNDRTRRVVEDIERLADADTCTCTLITPALRDAASAPTRRELLAMDVHNEAHARVDAKVDSVAPSTAKGRAEVRASLEAETIAEMLVRAKNGRMPRYFDNVHTDNNVVTFTRNGHTYTATLVEVRP